MANDGLQPVDYAGLRQVESVDQSDRKVPINLRQSGPTPVGLLISTRVRKSPYWHLSMAAGCWRATVYNRVYHPRGYVPPDQGGAMVEYDALVNHVTLWNVAVERQIQVKGPDAEAFVNHVVTRDATRIAPMYAKYVILCNEAGGVLNDPVLLRTAQDEFWFSLADSDLELWLRGVNVGLGFNVSIAEIDVAPVQVQGPKSEALMVDLFGDRVRDIPYYGLMFGQVAGRDVVVSQTGFTGEKGYEIYLKDATRYAEDLWHGVLEAGERHSLMVTAPAHIGGSPPASCPGGRISTRRPCRSNAISATRCRVESVPTTLGGRRWRRPAPRSRRARRPSGTCSWALFSAVRR